jgi:hypothetical protein
MRFVMDRMSKQPALAGRAALVADRKLSPFDMLPMKTLAPWLLGALLRGRFDVLKGFFRTGRGQGEGQRELARRQALLDALDTRAARPAALRAVPEAAAIPQAVGS